MLKRIYDPEPIRKVLEQGCYYYAKTAPLVSNWMDDLYIRIDENPENVTLRDLMIINILIGDNGIWIQPNFAQNIIYKYMADIKADTTGLISF